MKEALWIGMLQKLPGMGAASIRQLVETYGTAEQALRAMIEGDTSCMGKHKGDIQSFFGKEGWKGVGLRAYMDRLEDQLYAHDITLMAYTDPAFPARLHGMYNPPVLLSYRGSAAVFSESSKNIAMIGARKCSPYGKNVAYSFAKDLGKAGITIISGGAMGIDGHAHEGALDGDGITVAVMGCGLDQVYPRQHGPLFERLLAQGGALVSEYLPGTPPAAYHFPARNRIISGLSRAVVVVEAKKSSGSLITADMAVNDGRDVFAVPGNVLTPHCEGNHWLLRQGAMVLTSPSQILEEYGWIPTVPAFGTGGKRDMSFTPDQALVIHHLSTEAGTTVEDLRIKTGLPLAVLHTAILTLEINKIIERTSGSSYILSV